MDITILIYVAGLIIVCVGLTTLLIWTMFRSLFDEANKIQERTNNQIQNVISQAFTHLASRDVRTAAEAIAMQERSVVEKEALRAQLENVVVTRKNPLKRIHPTPDNLELITPDNIDEILGDIKGP